MATNIDEIDLPIRFSDGTEMNIEWGDERGGLRVCVRRVTEGMAFFRTELYIHRGNKIVKVNTATLHPGEDFADDELPSYGDPSWLGSLPKSPNGRPDDGD